MIYKFNIFFLIFLFLFSQDTYSHGFGANTLVRLADGSQSKIYSICLYALDHKIVVASCDVDKSCIINQLVETGKRSKCNCCIKLGFNNQFNEANDIICTPLQEFYVPIMGKWLPAYMLKPGDALLTANLTTKTIIYKELIENPFKIYMLEVQNLHTFFVGKDFVLTHNVFLPATMSIGFVIPFGSAATGTIGSFFGPVGLAIGVAFGGIVGITFKALYEKRLPRYKPFDFNINFIKQHGNVKPAGCFIPEVSVQSSYVYVTPLNDNLSPKVTGCIEITPYIVRDQTISSCSKYCDIEKINNEGCFQPIEQDEQLLFSTEQPIVEKPNIGNKPLFARNWKEFKENTPIGQEYDKKFIHTGKQNPKDGSPIYKLIEDIPNTEMFKKDYLFALDRFHDGDHFEVWDSKGKWIGVANLDGSRNEKKSNAEKNPGNRRLRNR